MIFKWAGLFKSDRANHEDDPCQVHPKIASILDNRKNAEYGFGRW